MAAGDASAAPAAPAQPNPPRPDVVAVDTPGGRYAIHIGSGVLHDADAWRDLPAAAQAMVVSNPTVHALHGAAVEAAIAPHYGRVGRVLIGDGERYKTWQTLDAVFDALLAHGCDRRTLVVALGGGVVGDVAGFAAACYQRGVPFVQVPTTLLAQVDSSVGGKTAINHPRGKNMIGAFHQPVRVVCDLATLATLPDRELRAGLAEVIKAAAVADAAFFAWLEAELPALLARDAAALAHAVRRSCEIKADVVGEDEREAGRRAILNFGHTFGHAIEAGVGYGGWLHGEAVACGMVIAASLSAELGRIDAALVDRLAALVARAGLPTEAPPLPDARWFELMAIDKKSQAGAIRYVLLDGLGAATVAPADTATVRRVIARHTAQR